MSRHSGVQHVTNRGYNPLLQYNLMHLSYWHRCQAHAPLVTCPAMLTHAYRLFDRTMLVPGHEFRLSYLTPVILLTEHA